MPISVYFIIAALAFGLMTVYLYVHIEKNGSDYGRPLLASFLYITIALVIASMIVFLFTDAKLPY